MMPSYGWAAIFVLVAVVFLTRNAFILLGERFRPQGLLARAFDYAPLAGIAALVVPDIVAPLLELLGLRAGDLQSSAQSSNLVQTLLQDARLPAIVALYGAGAIRRNALDALIAGIAVYVALRFIVLAH
jgi:branched-subunit amino acid transport protein